MWLCSATALLQVTVEDFEVVCKGLYRALCIREKYMQQSVQRFPRTPSQYLRAIEGEVWRASDAGPGIPRHQEGFPLWLQHGVGRGQKGVVEVLHRVVACPGLLFSVTVAGLPLPSAWGGGAWQACGVSAGSLCLMVFSFWPSVHPTSEGWTGSL